MFPSPRADDSDNCPEAMNWLPSGGDGGTVGPHAIWSTTIAESDDEARGPGVDHPPGPDRYRPRERPDVGRSGRLRHDLEPAGERLGRHREHEPRHAR